MRGRTWAKIGIVALVMTVMATAHALGVFQQLRDTEHARAMLVGLGAWGYLAFIFAYAVLQPFGVPGTVFVFVAPLIWPWPIAFGLSMAGTMAASVVGFSFARFVARDWVARKIPARFKKYDEALEKRAFSTVVILRFVFWMPPPLHAFLGISPVPFWTHFWGSLVGYALPLLATSFFGPKLLDAILAAPPWVWGLIGVATVGGLATWLFRRCRQEPVYASHSDIEL